MSELVRHIVVMINDDVAEQRTQLETFTSTTRQTTSSPLQFSGAYSFGYIYHLTVIHINQQTEMFVG